MNEHVFKPLDEDLQKLRSRLVNMQTIVREQVENVLDALAMGDAKRASLIIARDESVDKLDVKIDKLCMRLFALQQPVAGDLRLIMSALAVNKTMERISDYAVGLARKVVLLGPASQTVHRTGIIETGHRAKEMVNASFDAFLEGDVDRAREIEGMDEAVDRMHEENFERLVDLMTNDATAIEACSHLLIVNRNLERVADQAKNVADEVVFLVDAKIVKHAPKESPSEHL
jgi:phosphate transport system protein